MKTHAFLIGLVAFSNVATAQERLDGTRKGVTIFQAEKARLVCVDVKSASGKDAPVLLTSEIGGKAYVETIAMSGACINLAGKKDIVIKASAMAEPVTIRVGPSRNALK